MLERVDAHEGDVAKVTTADYRRIVDLCWQCKLCFNHCPYTPPHRFDIDFPRLMLRAKAARAKAEGVSWQDRWLGSTDTLGALGLGHGAPRQLGQLAPRPAGPCWRRRSASSATARCRSSITRRSAAGSASAAAAAVAEGHKVAFFTTCVVNYNEPQVGRDAVSVLEKNGCAVSCPESQVCCGMPYLDGGDIDAARANARRNIDALLPAGEGGGGRRGHAADLLLRPQEGVPAARAGAGRGGGGGEDVRHLRVPREPAQGRAPRDGLPRPLAGQGRLPGALPPARAEHGLQDARRAAAHPGDEGHAWSSAARPWTGRGG